MQISFASLQLENDVREIETSFFIASFYSAIIIITIFIIINILLHHLMYKIYHEFNTAAYQAKDYKTACRISQLPRRPQLQ